MEEKILEAIKNVNELQMSDDEAIKILNNDDSDIIKEFSLDSLLRVQFIIELEEIFDIEIDMEYIDMGIFSNCKRLKEVISKYIFEGK